MAKLSRGRIIALSATVLAVSAFCIAGCAPQSSGSSSGASQSSSASGPAWSLDMDCSTCHATEQKTMADGASGASFHVEHVQADCATCHTDESGLTKVHEGKTATSAMPKKLTATKVAAETCQTSGCHNKSAEEMAQLTAGYTALTDSKGTQVNPHEVMGLTPGHADITCANCHNMHEQEVAAADACVSCHHAGVYECNTCH